MEFSRAVRAKLKSAVVTQGIECSGIFYCRIVDKLSLYSFSWRLFVFLPPSVVVVDAEHIQLISI